MTVTLHNFVQDQISIVTGKEIPWESAALICTQVYATLSNITRTQSAQMKSINWKILTPNYTRSKEEDQILNASSLILDNQALQQTY